MSELKQFRLPDVGEGLTEADIVKWHVQPGDTVEVNQTIVDIETAKAMVELPCPFDGVVADLLVPEGQTVDVGTPIIAIDTSGGAGQAPAAESDTERLPQPSPATPAGTDTAADLAEDLVPRPPAEGAVEPGVHGSPAPAQERQPVLVGYGVKLGSAKRRPRKAPGGPAAVAQPAGTHTPPATQATPAAPAERADVTVLAKPPVRKLARELGVDLATINGTGPGGSVTRADVQEAADKSQAGADVGEATAAASLPGSGWPTVATGRREERLPVRGVRKHTAAAVASSAFTAPHVTEFLQVDMTATMDAALRVRDLPEFADQRVSPLVFVAKALILAVARHPMINSSWDEAGPEIVVKRYVNLGVAAATERGLLVPNIKDAHTLALPALARALSDLTQAARAAKTSPADLQGGTITITNVGVFGVDSGTPILTPGEAAILAFGQVRDMAWVHNGELAVRQVGTLALSFDHRIVDGDLGSAVLRDVAAMLEDPVRMIAWA